MARLYIRTPWRQETVIGDPEIILARTGLCALPRMSTRRSFLAVVVVAVTLWAKGLADRRAYYLTRAEVEADRADDYANKRPLLKEEYDFEGMHERLRDHYSQLARKYRLAANRPWLPVEPDPEPPRP